MKTDETCGTTLKNLTIFYEDLIAGERAKVKILLNRVIFPGFTFLDVGKALKYEFHFGYMKTRILEKNQTPYSQIPLR